MLCFQQLGPGERGSLVPVGLHILPNFGFSRRDSNSFTRSLVSLLANQVAGGPDACTDTCSMSMLEGEQSCCAKACVGGSPSMASTTSPADAKADGGVTAVGNCTNQVRPSSPSDLPLRPSSFLVPRSSFLTQTDSVAPSPLLSLPAPRAG